MASGLPHPPKVELEIVREKRDEGAGFLSLRRFELVCVRPNGTKSRTFAYDVVDRRALDASVMAAHYEENGRRFVYVRSAVRPPLALRSLPPKASPLLWELPAGLVEPSEEPRAAAAREVEEELGFSVTHEDMQPLGAPSYPAPGFIGEAHHYFHVVVDPKTRREPSGDGSPLEEDAQILALPLDDLLEACRRGEIRDAKTELALRRLADVL